MPKFDNDILLRNIKFQMEKSHETQKQVADAIGMSQPNFNKAINGVDSKLFTLEQLYNISQHFNVSIDRLMNNDASWSFGTADICRFLVKLIESGDAIFTDCELEETVYYTPETRPPHIMDGVIKASQKHTYKGLVFNIYREEFDDCKTSVDRQARIAEYKVTGNAYYKPSTINEFIKNYLAVFKLYKQGAFSKEIYEAAVDGLLQKADIDYLL